ncbi:MAG: shikimate kinase [Bacteroidales bacterium]|jgi:shikimate kinase|nr:shikimate kinase [Bacteroidales bacterium]
MKIFIVGFMYSGKTTFGKKIANTLSLKHIDTDKYFEEKYNISINDFFEKYSEDSFRKLEHEILLEIIKQDNIVVSTGGGLPCYYNNMDIMNKEGKTIYLNMSFSEIISRQRHSKRIRPLLKNKTQEECLVFIKDLLEEREKTYKKSQITIKGRDIKKSETLNMLRFL